MSRSTLLLSLFAAYLLSTLSLDVSSALANPVDVFNDNVQISDGKQGRVWNKWSRVVKEQTVVSVVATIKKNSGGNDTFINLRYGKGNTFENGKQVFLGNNQTTTAHWTVQEKPNGRPLVLNAYKGVVQVISVKIVYAATKPKTRAISIGASSSHGNTNSGRPTAHHPRSTPNNSQTVAICQRGNYNSPNIEISKVKSSGRFFSGKYRVSGSIRGSCVEEAGYFENGQLKEKFTFPYSARFKRQEFHIKARSGKGGEIRVYTTNGAESRIEIDQYISQSKTNSGTGGIFP